jgi:hypothetical protein
MPISKKSPCSRIMSSLLFAAGKAPSNPLPSKHLQLQVGASIPAFHEIHPANGRMQGHAPETVQPRGQLHDWKISGPEKPWRLHQWLW